jgi:hypothetical protein
MRHQRVYVAIFGGSENLEKEKGGVAVEGLKTDYRLERCSGNINKYQQIPSSSVAAMLAEAWAEAWAEATRKKNGGFRRATTHKLALLTRSTRNHWSLVASGKASGNQANELLVPSNK